MPTFKRLRKLFISALFIIIYAPFVTATIPTIYPAETQEKNFEVPFESLEQDIRDTGASFNPNIQLIDESWSPPNQALNLITNAKSFVNSLGLGGDVTDWILEEVKINGNSLSSIKLGAKADIESSGRIAFDVDFAGTGVGQVDIYYPIDVEVHLPKENTFRDGDTILISTNYKPGQDWYMHTSAERGQFRLDSNLGLKARIGYEICPGGTTCTSDNLLNLDIPENTRSLFSLSSEINGSNLPSAPFCDPVDDEEYLRWNITFCETFLHGISGFAKFPFLETVYADIQPDNSIIDGSRETFADLNLDVDKYLKYIGFPIPLGLQTPQISNFQFGYETIDYAFNVDIAQTRDVAFKPAPEVTIDLGAEHEYFVINGTNISDVVTQGSAQVVTLKVGQSLALTIPDNKKTPYDLDQSYDMRNVFSHEGTMVYNGDYTNTVLALLLTTPSFEIYGGANVCLFGHPEITCTKTTEICPTGFFCPPVPKVEICIETRTDFVCDLSADIPKIEFPKLNIDLGPLAVASIPFPETTQDIFPKTEFELGGFESQSKQALVLDPENPIIAIEKETSNILNLGNGQYQVTHALRVSNLGDVDLLDSEITDDLSTVYTDAEAFFVNGTHTCESGLSNPNYDGGISDSNLISRTRLAVDKQWLLSMTNTVTPKPYPLDFINTAYTAGTSDPRGTLVSNNNDSEIDLAPTANPELSDFALYATDRLSIENFSDSRGHVGANRKIEFEIELPCSHHYDGDDDDDEQENEGSDCTASTPVLAGNLYTPGKLEIEDGALIADYLFAYKKIKEEDGAFLEVFDRLSKNDFTGEFAIYKPAKIDIPPFNFSADEFDTKITSPTHLSTGVYGKVEVKKNTVMTLSSGDYYFHSIKLEDGAEININLLKDEVTDSALPININIVSKLEMGKQSEIKLTSENGTTRHININFLQDSSIELDEHSSLMGTITAPDSKVELKKYSHVSGAVYAREIKLSDFSSFTFHNDWNGELFKNLDTDCDGFPDIQY